MNYWDLLGLRQHGYPGSNAPDIIGNPPLTCTYVPAFGLFELSDHTRDMVTDFTDTIDSGNDYDYTRWEDEEIRQHIVAEVDVDCLDGNTVCKRDKASCEATCVIPIRREWGYKRIPDAEAMRLALLDQCYAIRGRNYLSKEETGNIRRRTGEKLDKVRMMRSPQCGKWRPRPGFEDRCTTMLHAQCQQLTNQYNSP